MMTTARASATRSARDSGLRVLVRVALAASLAGVCVAVVGAFTSGAEAFYGALVGTLLVVGIFSFGAFTVHVVSNLMPSASLMFALLTYTMQVVLMALAFAVLDGSGALDDGLDPLWLGTTVIAGTCCWLVAQVVLTARRRIPVYDLPDSQPAAPSGTSVEVGER